MLNSSSHVIVTLPIYGDTGFLENACNTLEAASLEITSNFTLLIAEDGSNSSEVVERLRKKYPNITYIQRDQRLGRGKALREAWKNTRGDAYVYLDADLATDLITFDAYRKLVQEQGGFDLVIGSRYLPESATTRPLLRKTASVAYNYLIRILFQTGVHDHQCGFKSFSSKLVQFLAVEARSDSWFWDTEVIVLAKKSGFKVKEIPVRWTEKKGTRTPLKRLVKDMWLHGSGLLALFVRVYLT